MAVLKLSTCSEQAAQPYYILLLAVLTAPPCALLHLAVQEANVWCLVCRSIAENAGRSDWRDVLQGKHNKDNRSGATVYGTTKLFNIMLAKEYSRRLQVTICKVSAANMRSAVRFPQPYTTKLYTFQAASDCLLRHAINC